MKCKMEVMRVNVLYLTAHTQCCGSREHCSAHTVLGSGSRLTPPTSFAPRVTSPSRKPHRTFACQMARFSKRSYRNIRHHLSTLSRFFTRAHPERIKITACGMEVEWNSTEMATTTREAVYGISTAMPRQADSGSWWHAQVRSGGGAVDD
jgi:hypothetical protein